MALNRRQFWHNVEHAARCAVKSCEFWDDTPNRTVNAAPYVRGPRDLRAIDDERHVFDVPELGSLGYPTRYALRVDAQTGLVSIFLA